MTYQIKTRINSESDIQPEVRALKLATEQYGSDTEEITATVDDCDAVAFEAALEDDDAVLSYRVAE